LLPPEPSESVAFDADNPVVLTSTPAVVPEPRIADQPLTSTQPGCAPQSNEQQTISLIQDKPFAKSTMVGDISPCEQGGEMVSLSKEESLPESMVVDDHAFNERDGSISLSPTKSSVSLHRTESLPESVVFDAMPTSKQDGEIPCSIQEEPLPESVAVVADIPANEQDGPTAPLSQEGSFPDLMVVDASERECPTIASTQARSPLDSMVVDATGRDGPTVSLSQEESLPDSMVVDESEQDGPTAPTDSMVLDDEPVVSLFEGKSVPGPMVINVPENEQNWSSVDQARAAEVSEIGSRRRCPELLVPNHESVVGESHSPSSTQVYQHLDHHSPSSQVSSSDPMTADLDMDPHESLGNEKSLSALLGQHSSVANETTNSVGFTQSNSPPKSARFLQDENQNASDADVEMSISSVALKPIVRTGLMSANRVG
jgi:hypothetical protein